MKKSLFASILLFSLLFVLCREETNAYELTEYKGVPVTYDENICSEWASWCYLHSGERKGTINMQIYRFEREYLRILDHEYAHYLYFEVLTDYDRLIWDIVSDKETMTGILKGIRMDVEYVGIYASKNKYEDFAESLSLNYNWEVKTYADVKQLIARHLLSDK